MSDWAKILDLGHDTTATRALVKTPTYGGWVARITGTSKQYELGRIFLDRVDRTDRDGKQIPRGWRWFRVAGSGLYEYRDVGDGELSGFFLIGWRGLREVDRDEAFTRARRMGVVDE
jgi:hypothetical protein